MTVWAWPRAKSAVHRLAATLNVSRRFRKQEFPARYYGRIHHSTVKNAPWRPVPVPRLRQKLELAAEYCEDIVSWGYQEWCRPALGDAARSWCAGYKKYLAACS